MDLGLRDGKLAGVSSRCGTTVLKARASSDMRPDDASAAMHWGARFMAGNVRALTVPAFDAYSKQPELKHAAVRLEPFTARWRGAFTAATSPDLHRAAASYLARFEYAAITLVEGPEILLRRDLVTEHRSRFKDPRRSRRPFRQRSAHPASSPQTAQSAPASKCRSPRSAPPSPPVQR